MRRILNTLAISLILGATILFSSNLFGQPQPTAPPPPQNHGIGGPIQGGGAPVGSGLILLLVLGAGYGTKKVIANRKRLTD